MASINELTNALESLISGTGVSLPLPSSEDLIRLKFTSLVSDVQVYDEETGGLRPRTTEEVDDAMTELMTDPSIISMKVTLESDLSNLKMNFGTFISTVTQFSTSLVTSLAPAIANPMTVSAVPGIVSGLKGQLNTITTLSAEVITSALKLGIEDYIPSSLITTINLVAGIKAALDALPI